MGWEKEGRKQWKEGRRDRGVHTHGKLSYSQPYMCSPALHVYVCGEAKKKEVEWVGWEEDTVKGRKEG